MIIKRARIKGRKLRGKISPKFTNKILLVIEYSLISLIFSTVSWDLNVKLEFGTEFRQTLVDMRVNLPVRQGNVHEKANFGSCLFT